MTKDEVQQIIVGSVVLYGKKKTPRIIRSVIIRSVKGWNGLKVQSVRLIIMKCSWTGRISTTVNRHDLASDKWTFTGAVVHIPGWQRLVFDRESRVDPLRMRLTCCDVVGLYW